MVSPVDLVPGVVIEPAEQHRRSLKNPASTIKEYPKMLEHEGLTEAATVLRELMLEIGNQEQRAPYPAGHFSVTRG